MNYKCLIYFLLCVSCVPSNNDISSIKINQNCENIKLSEFCDSVKYIALETTSNSLVGAIGKLQYVNNHFFISDLSQNKIFIFDSQGHFVRHIHREGRGPEEYNMINDFSISPIDTCIYIGDTNNKISKYSFEGKFIKSLNSPNAILAMNFVDNYLYIFSGFHVSHEAKDSVYYASILDMEGNILKTFGNVSSEIARVINNVTGGNIYVKNNKEFLFFYPYQNIVYKYIDNEIKPIIKIDFGEYSLPALTVDNIEKFNSTRFRGFAYLSSVLELKNKLYVWWIDHTKVAKKCLSIIDSRKKQIKTANITDQIIDDFYGSDAKFYIQMIDSDNNLIGINLPVQCPVLSNFLKLNEDDNPIVSVYYIK